MANTLQIPGLSPVDQKQLDDCLAQLARVSKINATRRRYLEAKQYVQHLGIAIPPQLENFETALEWPYKAVKALASRIKFDGFSVPGASGSDFGIDKIWAENRLGIESHHAHMSALAYGVSFVAVLAGGPGEPKAVIRALSPTSSTALWDANKRRTSAAVSITRQENGRFTELILFLEDKVVTCRADQAGTWTIESTPHKLGRCPVVMLSYDSSPEYPFGRSRITQSIMRLTDMGIRTALRMEVSAEFYSTPQRYILGADADAFVDGSGKPIDGFKATIGRILALEKDEDGDLPQVGTFPAQSMQPHTDMFRMVASNFAAAASLPTHVLGVINDQPDSDEAIKAKYLELAGDAGAAHEPFGAAWVDAIRMAIEIQEGSVPEEALYLSTKWRSPMYESKAAAADYAMKLVQVGVLPAESEVTLEMIGFDQLTIDRIVADRRKGAVSQLVSSLGAKLDAAAADPVVADVAAERGAG